jgi:hypothetical protein
VPLRVNPGGPQIKGARTLGRRNEELEAEIPDWHAEPSCGRRATSPILKLVFGEQAENIDRKDFAIEERVAIGGEIERLLGERRGRPSEKVQNLAPLDTGKTRDNDL